MPGLTQHVMGIAEIYQSCNTIQHGIAETYQSCELV